MGCDGVFFRKKSGIGRRKKADGRYAGMPNNAVGTAAYICLFRFEENYVKKGNLFLQY